MKLVIVVIALVIFGCKFKSYAQKSSVEVHTSQNRPDYETNPLDSAYSKDKTFFYEGYEIEKLSDSALSQDSITIKKDGKVLYAVMSGRFSEVGVFPFLGGGGIKQLVVETYSGGAHCCYSYRIYELKPNFRLLFNSDEEGRVGNILYPKDIDNDGRYEFYMNVMGFDYFYGLSHASSVFPKAVFAYDNKSKTFVHANHKFSNYLLEGIDQDKKKVEEARNNSSDTTLDLENEKEIRNSEGYLSPVLEAVLKYIYAGQEDLGWKLFDNEQKIFDKVGLRLEMQGVLENDSTYVSLYVNIYGQNKFDEDHEKIRQKLNQGFFDKTPTEMEALLDELQKRYDDVKGK